MQFFPLKITVIPPGEVERAESIPGREIKSEEVRREREKK